MPYLVKNAPITKALWDCLLFSYGTSTSAHPINIQPATDMLNVTSELKIMFPTFFTKSFLQLLIVVSYNKEISNITRLVCPLSSNN